MWDGSDFSAAWDSMFDAPSSTTLHIAGGYVGAPVTSPSGGYVGAQTVNAPGAPNAIGSWLQQNKTAVYAGAGVLALMAMFGGGGRRR